MMSKIVIRSVLLGSAVLAAVWAEPARKLELRGTLAPVPPRARVSIEGVQASRSGETFADSNGRFRFRNLPPGPYVVTVFAAGSGMTRRSVDVTPGLADARGRVETTVPLNPSTGPSTRNLQARNTVSLRDLSISGKARKEFDEAMTRERKRDDEGAVSHLQHAVEISPQFMRAWHELGVIAYRQHRWTEAEHCFRKALDLRPGAVMPALNLGGVLLYQGKGQEALPFNKLAAERAPSNPLANLQLGVNYYMLGRDREALQFLRTAKEIDPSHTSHPQLALAELHLHRGDRGEAVKEFEDFLARHPDSPQATDIRRRVEQLRTLTSQTR